MEKVQAKNESMIKALQPGKWFRMQMAWAACTGSKSLCLNRTRCQRHNCRKCHRTRQDLARTLPGRPGHATRHSKGARMHGADRMMAISHRTTPDPPRRKKQRIPYSLQPPPHAIATSHRPPGQPELYSRGPRTAGTRCVHRTTTTSPEPEARGSHRTCHRASGGKCGARAVALQSVHPG